MILVNKYDVCRLEEVYINYCKKYFISLIKKID